MAKKKIIEQETNGMDLIEDDGFITIDTQTMSDDAHNPDWLKMSNLTFTIDEPCTIDYKFNEKEIVNQIQEYVDATYTQHYAKNKFQATEFIFDSGHAEGFCIGNIMKYAQRYGKKDGYNRNDLMKVIHYAIMAVHNHDLNHQ